MADIRPFRALRFTEKAGGMETLTCPPYDIISEAERLAYLSENPHNVIRLELPREGTDPYGKAGEVLRQWREDGILQEDDAPGLYIYEEAFENRGQRMHFKGFICRVKLEPFAKGVVLPHEETLSKAKADRLNLMRATHCNFSQIYSLYTDPERITYRRLEALSNGRPEVALTDAQGVTHRLWRVTDSAVIEAICGDFAERKLYIADGHHRYETALNYQQWRREQGLPEEAADAVMMMLVDMENEGLVVYPTHRIIRDLPTFEEEALLKQCERYFSLTAYPDHSHMQGVLDILYRDNKKAFGLYTGGEGWTLLTLRDPAVLASLLPDASAALQGLDVTVLHSLILEGMLGIDKENMAQQINLTYTRDAAEALASVQSGQAQCAFLLNPTHVEEIRDVALAGEKMPQKSTYFYPKLITGLVMNALNV